MELDDFKEKVNELYYISIKTIGNYFGLKPTLLKKANIRKITESVLEREVLELRDGKKFVDGALKNEVIFIFMINNYDFNFKKDFSLLQLIGLEKGYDAIAEYFRRKQDEMHLI